MAKMLIDPVHEVVLNELLSEEELKLAPMAQELILAKKQVMASGLLRERDLIGDVPLIQ